VSDVELDININISSIKKSYEGLFEKEEKEEESRKDEEYLITPLTSLVGKEFLKEDCNTLNSHFL